MNTVTIERLADLFSEVGKRFAENAELLCEMDSRMGDGDLGLTMKKGFESLPEIIKAQNEENIGKTLRRAGMEMTDVVPSTMGMLMGTGVAYGGKALGDKAEIDAEGLVLFLEGFSEGIIKRGKCAKGDRTVLDAVATAAERAREAISVSPELSLLDTARIAYEGATEGVEATKSMVPKFGKAAVHANVAAGVADQGAVAGMIMVKGIYDYISK